MRITFIQKTHAVGYCYYTDHNENFYELSEETPTKCFKDMICDALYSVENKIPSNFVLNGRIIPNNLDTINEILEGLETDFLLGVRSYYILEGNWKVFQTEEFNIAAVIEKILTKRTSKSIKELNEEKDEHFRSIIKEEETLKNNKHFQKLLKTIQGTHYSQKIKNLLKLMETF